jgi:hypothetical protein
MTRLTVALESEAAFSTELEAAVVAVDTGPTTSPVRSLTKVSTPVVGWDGVFNFTVGTTGRARETDADMRERRADELQQSGVGTASGMRQSIEDVANVLSVTLIQNDTSSTDVDGRPPNSFESYVSGGDDDEIAQAIYDTKGIGIGIVTTSASTRTGNIIDVNGEVKPLTFSEPSVIPIELVVNITIDTFFPVDGDDLIKAGLVALLSDFVLGQDVLNHELYAPFNSIEGILTLSILQDTVISGSPAAANTSISSEQIASLSADNIIVVVS